MKKYFTLLILALLPTIMMAQNKKDKGNFGFNPEMHRQNQHKFMMDRAQMSKEDSIKFFAVYDEMRAKEREIYGASHKMRNKMPETDEECRNAMLEADSLELAIKQLQYDYHLRLLNSISPKKAAIAILSGEQFDRMAFRNMFGGHMSGQPGMMPGQPVDAPNQPGFHPNDNGGKDGQHPDFDGPRPDIGGPGMGGALDGGLPHSDMLPMN